MKTWRIVLAGLLIVVLSSCGPSLYKSNQFDSSVKSVKQVAIIPFNVSIDGKRLPKGVTLETVKEFQKKSGYDFQNAAYSWLLRRQQEYSVNFQDIDKTNSIVKKANLTYDDLMLMDKGEICKLLGVDAIISGKAAISRPMSDGAAITVGLIAGYWGSTNKTILTLDIHNVESDLLWKFDWEVNGSVGSSAEQVTRSLMKKASKKFPYKNG